mmetsp:Transcript_5223/g.8087  ORF Transcript_5223/g.8087 Transcript_5223/m.8087 type:complete len:188 (-) Transcript_5223:2954-3517(-)
MANQTSEAELKELLAGRHDREDPDPLTRQQVNQCLMDIEDIHPLRSRAKLDHIVPALQVFRKCFKRKPDFKHSLRKTLLEEMNIKMPKSENQLIEDPFLILGYGVNAYFDIMLALSYMFLTIAIFCIPVYYAFAYNESHGLMALSKGFKYSISQWSIGNMGGAITTCHSKAIKAGDFKLGCPNAANA